MFTEIPFVWATHEAPLSSMQDRLAKILYPAVCVSKTQEYDFPKNLIINFG
jgi:hypothetical protein